MNIRKIIRKILDMLNKKDMYKIYQKRYKKYSFTEGKCKEERQFEASITKLYHSVEKGLSYAEYRAGFGRNNIDTLISSMNEYSSKYNTDAFFYETALDVLNKYVSKNKEYGLIDEDLEKVIASLPGTANDKGGVIHFTPLSESEVKTLPYEEFIKNRHSIREFSGEAVDVSKIRRALELGQYTPSACNRQGWKSRIITDKETVSNILKYQNGNRGFGEKIDKLVVITSDLECFNSSREIFQAYIDGGMYSMSVINALHNERIGAVPLSASLTYEQEKNVRKLAKIEDNEVLIMFIGCGSYPEECVTTCSQRRPADITEI